MSHNENKKEHEEKESSDEVSEASSHEQTERDFEEGFKNNPLEYHKLCLNTDYYSITWTALRKMQFIGISFNFEDIYLLPSDYFWIYINFISFFTLLLLTIFLLVKEALINDKYKNSGWLMYILRITLVVLAQRKLLPEFNQGYCKLLYTLQKKREFTHPGFAIFVSICQMFVVSANLISIIFFICMADEYIQPITNFSGLCVLSELDDWIGDLIMSYQLNGFDLPETQDKINQYIKYEKTFEKNPHEHQNELHEVNHLEEGLDDEEHHKKEERNKKEIKKTYNMYMINERMSLTAKLATIRESDLEIEIDDKIQLNAHWTIVYIEKLIKNIPWNIVIPLLTIPISYSLPSISHWLRIHFES